MTPDAATVLIARSQPNVVVLLVLGAASVGLAYVGLMAFDMGVRMIGPYRLGRPPQDLAVFFLFLAVVMFGVAVWQIRRRLVPNVDVVADAEGITSQQSFWGREPPRLERDHRARIQVSRPALHSRHFPNRRRQTPGDRHQANRRAGH
jgi:predicted small integral membrane protein